jgi:hypothetical protein
MHVAVVWCERQRRMGKVTHVTVRHSGLRLHASSRPPLQLFAARLSHVLYPYSYSCERGWIERGESES